MSNETENERLRAQLDRAAAELDELTVAKLRGARKHALAQARRPLTAFGWLSLSAIAATFVAVAVAAWWWPTSSPPTLLAEDVEWSLTRDDPEFFTDLEFYDWIRNEQDAG